MKSSFTLAVAASAAHLRKGGDPGVCQACGGRIAGGLSACFQRFAGLCARGYAEPLLAGPLLYGVDAHALQHPEIHGKKNNAAHLLRLHGAFARGPAERGETLSAWWRSYVAREDLPVLAPPPAQARGEITVADLDLSAPAAELAASLAAWARRAYSAWAKHHPWAERELERWGR